MKRIAALLVLVCMLLIPMSTSFAMTQKELRDYREQAQETLNNTQSVTWYDLNNNESGYAGSVVKFTAAYIGSESSAGFKDRNGKLFVIATPLPYRFRVGTEYTVGAVFSKMVTVDGETAAVFTSEQIHLPVMSEYGL